MDEVDFSDPQYPYGVITIGTQRFHYIRPLPEDKSLWDNEPIEMIKETPQIRPNEKVIEGVHFESAQENAKRYGPRFEAPSWEDLRSIQVGQYVKVCHNDERFWVIVLKLLEHDEVIGRIDNRLVNQHPFNINDLIRFKLEHVYTYQ